MKRFIRLLVFAVSLCLFSVAIHLPKPVAYASDCVANNNLNEIADKFISRCRKASIRREFPRELLNVTLREIKAGKTKKHKTAWKLLNDKRFEKEQQDDTVVAKG